MPELPEVEVVRRGLQQHVTGRRLERVSITGSRIARRHPAGPIDLADRLTGRRVRAARRRGKYLWLELDGNEALVLHLGMSGQLLVQAPDSPVPKHTHALFDLDDGMQLRFVDQRTFGGLQLAELIGDRFGGSDVPQVIAHIAPDPFDAVFDPRDAARRARARHTQIKRAMLDQTWVSGIGNIYADEALWQARVHGERMTNRLAAATIRGILEQTREVMDRSLAQGGTTFDALYVNVNGASGYFERSLNVYGRAGQPCRRCGTLIRRVKFMNRSSYFCPRCQRRR